VHPPAYKYYGKVKQTIEAEVRWVPWAVAHLPVLPALNSFNGGDPIPDTFNRHASAHAVSATQYTEVNTMIALMLTTSVLREAHHTEHELPDEDDDGGEDSGGN
jgi:hypothetical protein